MMDDLISSKKKKKLFRIRKFIISQNHLNHSLNKKVFKRC